MALAKQVAKNAKAIRIQRGLSQQQLAKKTGLTVRYISRLENSAQNVTLDVLERLKDGLECSAAELIGDHGSETSNKKSAELLDQTIRFLQSLRSRL